MIALLAKIDLDFPTLPNANRAPNQIVPALLMIIAAILILVALIVIWAVFLRKPKEVRTPAIRTQHSQPVVTETPDGRLRVRKKHRRRRREHRVRNPTLAETGGLPGAGDHPSSSSN